MDYNFIEVIEHFNRMCKQHEHHCSINECPIADLIAQWETEHEEWERDCIYFATKYPYDFAKAVMEWAKTHPVPQYGTIRDVVKEMFKMLNVPEDYSIYHYAFDTEINKEVADRFNIKPINYPNSI